MFGIYQGWRTYGTLNEFQQHAKKQINLLKFKKKMNYIICNNFESQRMKRNKTEKQKKNKNYLDLNIIYLKIIKLLNLTK